MKRLLLTLAASALGSLIVLPIAQAQSWQDMHNDSRRIERDTAGIRHDREELREDVRNGRYGAAAHEQAEIAQRKADRQAWRNDLNNDIANRYYSEREWYGDPDWYGSDRDWNGRGYRDYRDHYYDDNDD